jgi:hypothetical protein
MAPRIKSIVQLRRELAAKEKALDALQSRRDVLAAQLEQLDRQIVSLTGTARSRRKQTPKKRRKSGRRRRATGTPLVQYIQAALKKTKSGMRVKDVATAVGKAGYKSHSKDFYTIVAAALRDTSKFIRARRGVYKLKR